MRRGEFQDEGIRVMMERTYRIQDKGSDVILEELKKKVIVIKAKLERYDKQSKIIQAKH